LGQGGEIQMKKFIFSILFAGLFLTGCAENEAADWKVDPTFTKDNAVLYGTEGKFGVQRRMGKQMSLSFQQGKGDYIIFPFWKMDLVVKHMKSMRPSKMQMSR
jgi:hypothetical protein